MWIKKPQLFFVVLWKTYFKVGFGVLKKFSFLKGKTLSTYKVLQILGWGLQPQHLRNPVPALSMENKQPTLKKLRHRNSFTRTQSWLPHRNEPLVWNFSLLFLEAIFIKLYHHNHEQDATPTHTKNKRPWSAHLQRNYNLKKYKRVTSIQI